MCKRCPQPFYPAEQECAYEATRRSYVPVVRCARLATTTGQQCRRGALKGSTLCQKHASLPRVKAKAKRNAARQEMDALAAKATTELALPMPTLPVARTAEDFAAVAGEYVGCLNMRFVRLENELNVHRANGTPEVEIVRLYKDVLDRQDTTAVIASKMMAVVAALGFQAEKHTAAPLDKIMAMLAATKQHNAEAAALDESAAALPAYDAYDDEPDDDKPPTCYPVDFGDT